MGNIIFYSWQSDLPNATNRGFIELALERAVNNIQADKSIMITPAIERDTQGVPGSPNIAETIFAKISNSQVFVADISLINSQENVRRTPNPNVLIELGFAMSQLGNERIIMVQNLAYGTPEMLPFDLRLKRVLTYRALSTDKTKANERNILSSKLEKALRLILETSQNNLLPDRSILAWYDVLEGIRQGKISSHLFEDVVANTVVNKMGRSRLRMCREDELSVLKNEFVELYNILSEKGYLNESEKE